MGLLGGLENILRRPLRGLTGGMGKPNTPDEMYQYLAKDSRVAKYIEANPQYAGVLTQKVQDAFNKYGSYRQKRSVGGWIEKAFDYLGLAGDMYFMYNPVGGLGIKLISTIGKTIADLPGLLGYAFKTGDYMSIPKLLAAKAASYVPTADLLVDSSLDGIIRRKTASYAREQFLKEVAGGEVPYRKKAWDRMSEVYSGVKDRTKNIFRPVKEAFNPEYSAQPAYVQ